MPDVTLESLSELTDDELLIGLGRSLGDDRLGARPGELIARAKQWLEAERPKICQALCKIPILRQLAQDSSAARRLEGLAAAADLLALSFGKPTAAWASTFVLRIGVTDYCAGLTPPTAD